MQMFSDEACPVTRGPDFDGRAGGIRLSLQPVVFCQIFKRASTAEHKARLNFRWRAQVSSFGETAKKPQTSLETVVSRPATCRDRYWLHKTDVGFHHLLVLESWLHKWPRDDVLIAVHPRCRRRCERIGFKVTLGTGKALYKHINQLATAMATDLKKHLRRPRSYGQTCASLLPFFEQHHYSMGITVQEGL